MKLEIDIAADLNAQDDDGRGWSVLSDASHPDRVVTGALMLAGDEMATAVVRITAVDHDGQVRFDVLQESVATNRHLLSPAPG